MSAVQVDDRFVRVGGKSFATNKITSVEIRKADRPAEYGWIVFGVAAAALLFWALLERSNAIGIVAIICAGLAWKGFDNRSRGAKYQLFLVTAAGENQAFETADEAEILELRDAIENAVARTA